MAWLIKLMSNLVMISSSKRTCCAVVFGKTKEDANAQSSSGTLSLFRGLTDELSTRVALFAINLSSLH